MVQYMVLFEILSEDGFQRKGRLRRLDSTSTSERIKTPLLVLPFNEFLGEMDDYIELLNQNPQVITQIYDQKKEGLYSRLNGYILHNLKTNYYNINGEPEPFIQHKMNSNSRSF